jgi:transcription elongation factor GreA
MIQNYSLTESGLLGFQHESKSLRSRMLELSRQLSKVYQEPQTSQNGDVETMLDEIDYLEKRLEEVNGILALATALPKPRAKEIRLGSTVVLRCNHKKVTYRLVNSVESDPLNNKISIASPLGRSLLGRREHARVLVETPQGVSRCKVVKIL